MIKTSLICLGIALTLQLAFSQTVEVFNSVFNSAHGSNNPLAQRLAMADKTWKDPARQVYFVGGINNDRWLTVIRFDSTAPEQHGFDPRFTYCVTKADVIPIVKKLPNGMWQISFTSELAQKNGGIP
jgi:hypothetical protein